MNKMMHSPEPMSLGSPTQSPPVNNQYLPQFLLGEMPSNNQNNQRNSGQHNSKYWGSSNSPPRSNFHHPSLVVNNQGQPGLGPSSGSGSSISRSYSIGPYDSNRFNNSNLVEKNEPGYHYQHGHYQGFTPHNDRLLGSTTIMGGNILASGGSQSNNLNTTSNLNPNDRSNLGVQQQQQQQPQIPGAPPINRLVDMLNKTSFTPSNTSGFASPNDASTANRLAGGKFTSADFYVNNSNQDLPFTPNHGRVSPPSPNQVDPFYNYGESIKMDEKLDDCWITIFGFPPSATSYVLQEFSVYGQIVKHLPSTQGNWLHIQYQTKMQAQKALSKNGKVLANSLMVGVMPCIDKKIMATGVNTSIVDTSLGGLGSANLGASPPQPQQQLQTSTTSNRLITNKFNSGCKLDRTQSLRTGIRPLGLANRNLDNNSPKNQTNDDSNLPKKNSNVISKAMEYMFGW